MLTHQEQVRRQFEAVRNRLGSFQLGHEPAEVDPTLMMTVFSAPFLEAIDEGRMDLPYLKDFLGRLIDTSENVVSDVLTRTLLAIDVLLESSDTPEELMLMGSGNVTLPVIHPSMIITACFLQPRISEGRLRFDLQEFLEAASNQRQSETDIPEFIKQDGGSFKKAH